MDVGVEKGLLAVWMALFALFAARKFTQPIKVRGVLVAGRRWKPVFTRWFFQLLVNVSMCECVNV